MMPNIELPSAARKKSGDREGNISARGLSHSGTVEADSSPMASASGRAVALPDTSFRRRDQRLWPGRCCVARVWSLIHMGLRKATHQALTRCVRLTLRGNVTSCVARCGTPEGMCSKLSKRDGSRLPCDVYVAHLCVDTQASPWGSLSR